MSNVFGYLKLHSQLFDIWMNCQILTGLEGEGGIQMLACADGQGAGGGQK